MEFFKLEHLGFKMFICCPDYSRKSLRQNRCVLGAGKSSYMLSRLFPSWCGAFSSLRGLQSQPSKCRER